MIHLPYGRPFDENALITHIRACGRSYIIQGQQASSFANHSKPQSLDYWLREHYANNPDTKQAENSVLDALVATGLFAIASRLTCPDSGARCKGFALFNMERPTRRSRRLAAIVLFAKAVQYCTDICLFRHRDGGRRLTFFVGRQFSG